MQQSKAQADSIPDLALVRERYARLEMELRHALASTSLQDLRKWAGHTLLIFPKVTYRRGIHLVEFVKGAVKFTAQETGGMAWAALRGRLPSHVQKKSQELRVFARNKKEESGKFVRSFAQALRSNPKETAVQLFLAFVGFNVGGGGLDGDGGIPDTDLAVSIGQHRSIFTHSVLPMVVIETLSLSLVELVRILHGNLPRTHDPLWDAIKSGNEKVLRSLNLGLSAGVAYHLGVDATVQGEGTYKDLPVSLPQEGHQTLLGVNAVAEGVDVAKTKRVLNQGGLEIKIKPKGG